MRIIGIVSSIVLGALALLPTGAFAAAQLSANSDPSATLSAGVRYRNLSGSGSGGATELQVFPSPYSATVTEGQGTWPVSSTVTITYDGVDRLSTTAAGATVIRSVGRLGNLNYIEIQITKNGATNSVALNSISLNGGHP